MHSTHQSLGQPAWQLFKPAPLSPSSSIKPKHVSHIDETILHALFAYKFQICFSFSGLRSAQRQGLNLKGALLFSVVELRQLGRCLMRLEDLTDVFRDVGALWNEGKPIVF